jgi:xanthosine utilization system XapX-like protein
MIKQSEVSRITEPVMAETTIETTYERATCWPVSWSGVWVGALAAIVAVLLIGLVGIAVGAHVIDRENRWVDVRKLSIAALVFSVCGAFFSFVIGGWIADKIAGFRRAEPAMLHGALSWLIAVPLLVAFAGLGAGSLFAGWHAGLSGSPSWAAASALPFERPEPPPGAVASEAEWRDYRTRLAEYNQKVEQWKADSPKVARNTALGGVTALLLGLVGSVLGGWLASGEPMSVTYYRTRTKALPGQ